MKKGKKIKVIFLIVALVSLLTAFSFKFLHGDYDGYNGQYRSGESPLSRYPYTIRLSFSQGELHRIEKDADGEVKINKIYSLGSSTSNGKRTSYKELNGTEILVGIDSYHIFIDTKFENGTFQNHIIWDRIRK